MAGRLLGINPFDQPDVESAKKAARGLLDAQPDPEDPAFVDDGIEVRAHAGLLDGAATVAAARSTLCSRRSRRDGYLAVMAFLDRDARRRSSRTSATRWRCAPSGRSPSAGGRGSCTPPASTTRAGPRSGVYLQVTAERRAATSRSPTGRSPSDG